MTVKITEDDNLEQLFYEHYNNSGTLVARFLLLDEDGANTDELVVADIYSNGNEFSVDAHTWHRAYKPSASEVRINKDPTLEDGRWLGVQLEFDLEDMKVHSSVPISETVFRTLVYKTKKLLEAG